MDIGLIFLTGLTTGGLTCLAVQGGLLATALAQRSSEAAPDAAWTVRLRRDSLPISSFLAAKWLAHLALGFWLGLLGSALRITPTIQGVMQVLVGLLMLVSALNLLDVHPFFRRFSFQPPKRLTRLVRQQAKSDDWLAPAFLGLMTILIPCGTTQAMALLAISSGDALQGALIMGAFTLGTIPTFFVLGFIATQAQGRFRTTFARVTAALVLFLGFASVDSGLMLLESPIVPSRTIAAIINPPQVVEADMVDGWQEITMRVLPDGYAPNHFVAQAGVPLRLRMQTSDTYGCALAFMIPSLNIFEVLPNTGDTLIYLPPMPEGDLYFMCSMGMYGGQIRLQAGEL